MKYRCSECHKELKNGTLNNGKLYCFKCYYFKNNPINIKSNSYIHYTTEDTMVML